MILGAASAAIVVGGCAVTASGPAGPTNKDPRVRRDTTVKHEPCAIDASGAERLDANGDGRADVTTVLKAGRPACRAMDLNFDGIVDSWTYFDDQGRLRRRELALGRTAQIVEVQVYAAGKLAKKMRATTLRGKLDTWHFYKAGVLIRTERDGDGDGVIDQWWDHPRPNREDCPLVHSDVDGDGRPDPDATVDMCEQESFAKAPPATGGAGTGGAGAGGAGAGGAGAGGTGAGGTGAGGTGAGGEAASDGEATSQSAGGTGGLP